MSGFKQISNLKFEAVSLPEPLHCCVKGCSNTSVIKLENSNESSVKAMFKVIQNSSIEYEKIGTQYVVKRRNSVQSQAWISNIKKHNGQLWEPDANSHVCHGHFLTGKPSIDKSNVDFAPTIFPLLHKMERMNDTRNRGRNERQHQCRSQGETTPPKRDTRRLVHQLCRSGYRVQQSPCQFTGVACDFAARWSGARGCCSIHLRYCV